MQAMTPARTLITTNEESPDYLKVITENIQYYDTYFLKYNYATLECVTDDALEILDTLIPASMAMHAYKWEKLYNITGLEYNPIWNYDGETVIETVYGATEETQTNGETHVTTDDKTAPFDSSTVRQTGETETTADEHTITNASIEHTDTVTETKGGNQGVTTTQQMIREERDIAQFNYIAAVYRDLVNDFTFPTFGGD